MDLFTAADTADIKHSFGELWKGAIYMKDMDVCPGLLFPLLQFLISLAVAILCIS